MNEREVAADLLEARTPPRDLLADNRFNGAAFAAQQAARGTAVLVPPTRDQRKPMPPILQKIIAEWRNRVEASLGENTDLMELTRHGTHRFWGPLTRTAATIAAHTLLRLRLARFPRRRSTHITRLRRRVEAASCQIAGSMRTYLRQPYPERSCHIGLPGGQRWQGCGGRSAQAH